MSQITVSKKGKTKHEVKMPKQTTITSPAPFIISREASPPIPIPERPASPTPPASEAGAKAAVQIAAIGVGEQAVIQFGSIIIALAQAAKSSPLICCVMGLIVTNVAKRAGAIDPFAASIIQDLILLAAGTSVVSSALDQFEKGITFGLLGGSAKEGLLSNTITTDVNTGGGGLDSAAIAGMILKALPAAAAAA